MADDSLPTLLSFTLTDTVTIGASPVLQFSANAKDADGIAYVRIDWTGTLSTREPNGQQQASTYSHLLGGNSAWTSGTRSIDLTVNGINEPGVHTVQQVVVGDMLNNFRVYSAADLAALGFDTSFKLVGSTPDRTAPTLNLLDIPTTVDTSNGPARWTLTAGATDVGSEVIRIQVDIDGVMKMSSSNSPTRPSVDQYYDYTTAYVFANATDYATGKASNTNWVAAKNGVYNFRGVTVSDSFGNDHYYDAATMNKMGIATHVTVSDGSFVAPAIVKSAAVVGPSANQEGMIVVKIATNSLKAGANSVELSINYNADQAHFDGWAGTSPGAFALENKTLEVGKYGETILSGSIDASSANGVIELRFKPAVSNGSFKYDLTGMRINGSSVANSFDGALDFRIPTLHSGTAGADHMAGDWHDELFEAGAGNDIMIGDAGMDELRGGAGTDTALYGNARAHYKVERSGAELVVRNLGAVGDVDRLNSVEILKFADLTMAFDPASDTAAVYRLYKAAFDRAPDAAGLGFWVHAREAGVSMHDIAAGFVASKEFTAMYGASATNASIVKGFYQNVLDRQPDAGGTAFWEGVLDRKAADVADVLTGFSDSAENQAGLATLIGQGMSYIPYG